MCVCVGWGYDSHSFLHPHLLEVIAPAMALFMFLDIALFALMLVLLKGLMSKKSIPLPPGPRKLPLLENLLDMPTTHEWFKFAEWGEKWGTFPPTYSLIS